MRLFRLFVIALWLAALGLATPAAHAAATGTMTVSPPTWMRKSGSDRPINQINRQDCLNDAVASFSIKIVNATGQFEVWSGAGCDMYTNRSPTAAAKTCVQVFAGMSSTGLLRADIHVRDMINTYGSPAPDATTPTSVAACDSAQGVGLQTRNLFFIVYNASDFSSLIGTTPQWTLKYDVTPPLPPSGVGAQSGENSLVTSFTPPTGETNLLRYHFYCSPIGSAPVISAGGSAGTAGTDTGGTAGTGGAAATAGTAGTDTGGTAGTDTGGTAGTGGTDTAGTGGTTAAAAASGGTSGAAGAAGTAGTATADPNCAAGDMIAGSPPPADAISCGSIPAQGATGGETSPVLENGTPYAVAVSTEDELGNIGNLSNLSCNVPKNVIGFYEAYRTAGGEAGGGYCSFAPARRGGALAGFIALMFGALALVWRRK